MYVLHLSGDTVKILEGACTRRKLVINSLYSVAMPCDYLDAPDDKGYEKIEAVVTNGLRDLGEEFKNKKIRVVLDNINIPFKEMVVPTLDRKKTIALVKNEIFSDEKLADSNTVDYLEMEKKVDGQKQTRIMVTYVDNVILQDIQKLCKNLMFKLVSIDVGQNCTAKHLHYIAPSLPESYVFAELRDTVVTVSLVIGGTFRYCISKSVVLLDAMRFKSERTYFVNDIGNVLRSAIEIFRKEYPDFECKNVIIAASPEKFELLRKPVQEKLGVAVDALTVPDNVDSIAPEDYSEFFCTIGGLIRED